MPNAMCETLLYFFLLCLISLSKVPGTRYLSNGLLYTFISVILKCGGEMSILELINMMLWLVSFT